MFLEDVRKVMGVPEWMIGVDSRRTRVLHQGACIQILLHFTGPEANRIELDFSKFVLYNLEIVQDDVCKWACL